MEGRHEEYMNNKGQIHAMFADCLENTLLLPDPPVQSVQSFSPPLPSSSPELPPVLDSEPLLPPLVNICVTSPVMNSDFHDDLYIHSVFEFSHLFTFVSVGFSSATLMSLVNTFNTLLDSGCTHHIIWDRALSHHYV